MSARSDAPPSDTPTAWPKRSYRSDVDGLRGLAVGLVVVFHVWFGKVSGGVDVFLTLSGYFFIGSLVRLASTKGSSLSAWPHIIRLARRLLPVLVVSIAATVLLSLLAEPQTRWLAIMDHAFSSIAYVQNWELALTSESYAAAGTKVSPLQHLWSMSVQGQFYLLCLALVLSTVWLWRKKWPTKNPAYLVAGLLAVVSVASFIRATQLQHTAQPWNYYDTGSRLWEIFIGGIVAILCGRLILPAWARTVTTITGLALIISCGIVIDGVNLFPGPWALYPVGGTILLLIGGNTASGTRIRAVRDPIIWLLGRRPLRELGRIAYSLYLWHWPLLILWLSYSGTESVNLLQGSIIVLISLALAWISERYVETPLRQPGKHLASRAVTAPDENARRDRKKHWAWALSVVSLLAIVAANIWWTNSLRMGRIEAESRAANTSDYPGAQAYNEAVNVPVVDSYLPSLLEVENDLPASTKDGCISTFSDSQLFTCQYGSLTAEKTVVLAGGSHAEHWLTAFDALGQTHDFKVVTMLKMGCPLTRFGSIDFKPGGQPYPECPDWTQRVLSALVEMRPDMVVSTSTRPSGFMKPDYTPTSYQQLWEFFAEHDLQATLIRDTPWLDKPGGPVRADDCLAEGNEPDSCGTERRVSFSEVNPALIAAAGLPNIHHMDFTDSLCNAVYCPAVVGNVVVYHDSHHMSGTFVKSLVPEIEKQFGVATGWW